MHKKVGLSENNAKNWKKWDNFLGPNGLISAPTFSKFSQHTGMILYNRIFAFFCWALDLLRTYVIWLSFYYPSSLHISRRGASSIGVASMWGEMLYHPNMARTAWGWMSSHLNSEAFSNARSIHFIRSTILRSASRSRGHKSHQP